MAFHRAEFERLLGELNQSAQESMLPEEPSRESKRALNDLLIRLRLQ